MKTFTRLLFAARAPLPHDWFALPLRLIIGIGFMEHGWAKLSRGADSFAEILQAIGVPQPELASWLVIAVELAGGLAVLAGAFIPLVSIPMTVVLLVAIFTVHLPNGFSSIKLQSVTAAGAHFGQPGYETDLLYLACLAALVIAGPGPLAIFRKRATRQALLGDHLPEQETEPWTDIP